jgi:hypothetical protein
MKEEWEMYEKKQECRQEIVEYSIYNNITKDIASVYEKKQECRQEIVECSIYNNITKDIASVRVHLWEFSIAGEVDYNGQDVQYMTGGSKRWS